MLCRHSSYPVLTVTARHTASARLGRFSFTEVQGKTELPDTNITNLLVAWRGGDPAAFEALLPMVYGQLKRLAGSFLRQERQEHTLQATALVHEAYVRLVELQRVEWQDRAHFFALCARLMRRILVDHARHNSRVKRGGGVVRVPLDEAFETAVGRRPDFLELDRALRDLAAQDATMAEIVTLRYFGGLNRDELGEVLGIGSATVTRQWRRARAWLLQELSHQPSEDGA